MMAEQADRRQFLIDGLRVAGCVTFAGGIGFLAGRRGSSEEWVWQLDPDECTGCGQCATHCVLDESAVKCVNCFDMCGYCDVCTGYFVPDYQDLTTAAENQLCPTGAITRTFIESKSGQNFFEYTIDKSLCIGCGKCVVGCALMNGSLYLQVEHDRCLNCNECSIATACPTQAFRRVPAERPEILKRDAASLLNNRGQQMLDRAVGDPEQRREGELLKDRARWQDRLRTAEGGEP